MCTENRQNTENSGEGFKNSNEIVIWADNEIGESIVNDTFFDIVWGNANSPNGISSYKIYVNDLLYFEVNSSVHRIHILNLEKETTYKIEIFAVDSVGNISTNNPIKYITTTDKRYANRNIVFHFPYNLNISEENYKKINSDPGTPITKILKADDNNLLFLQINGLLYAQCKNKLNSVRISEINEYHFAEIGYSSLDIDTINKKIYFLYSNSLVDEDKWHDNQNNKAQIFISSFNYEYTSENCINIDLLSKKEIYSQVLYWKSHTNGNIKVYKDSLIFSVGDNITYAGSIDPNKNQGKIFSIPVSEVINSESEMNNYKIAIGLRNPYRFEVINNDMYIFDVGENRFEEINVLDLEKNQLKDFGWPYAEGYKTFQNETGIAGMKRFLKYNNVNPNDYRYYDFLESYEEMRNKNNFSEPITTYQHTEKRCAIIGSGEIMLNLIEDEPKNYLMFADYCSGELFVNNYITKSPDIIKVFEFDRQVYIFDIEILNNNEIMLSTSEGIKILTINY